MFGAVCCRHCIFSSFFGNAKRVTLCLGEWEIDWKMPFLKKETKAFPHNWIVSSLIFFFGRKDNNNSCLVVEWEQHIMQCMYKNILCSSSKLSVDVCMRIFHRLKKNLFVKYYSWHGMAYYWEELCCGSASLTHSLTNSLGCKKDTLETKKRKIFFLIFRLNRKLCTEMHWCNATFCTYMHASREREREGEREVKEWEWLCVLSFRNGSWWLLYHMK